MEAVPQCFIRGAGRGRLLTSRYPLTFAEIGAWSTANQVAIRESQFRFAQYGVLRAVSDSRTLSESLVFKGGNALDFMWCPNRSTLDLDFSSKQAIAEDRLQTLLASALQAASRLTSTAYRVQRFKRQPPSPSSTFITYEIKVGYALAAEQRNRQKIGQDEPVSTVVPMDISLNEPICGYVPVNLSGTHPLLVSSLEDIVAEKLRALLQQIGRNRHRRQDVLDIAVLLHQEARLNRQQVAQFLLQKAKARDVAVSRAAFHNEEVRRRAEIDYDQLRETTRVVFIPFPEAFAAVLRLIAELDLPEQ